MQPTLSKRAANRQHWRELFERWQQTGETPKTFCEQNKVGLSSFLRWRRIFKTESNTEKTESTRFIPVTVSASVASPIIIRLDNGLSIEVPTAFDADALQQIIQLARG